ncbi:MAG TPA: glycosyl hydrolase family 79 C-terminal domain-containing protein [Candidatus Acidoferrum sp.]|nr:glycosyl hydrolase family 79 C-terminal domain-containing protein [Candidatus Acidoferrum sp.]
MNWRTIAFNAAVFVSTMILAGLAQAQTAMTVSVDARHPGAAISPDFIGLSFELSQVLADDDGVHYFRPDNQPLINLFHTLGIKSLRVGGNTADRSVRELPDRADIDSLFAFAKAADVKVIYCLRLRYGDAAQDASVARYIMDHYPDQIDCFSIGQEPNVYPKTTNAMGVVTPRPTYAQIAPQWKRFESIIAAAVPNIRLCGPSVDDNPEWPQEFMRDFGRGYHVAMITAHLYPGRNGELVPSPEVGRDRMLSAGFVDEYQKLYNGFAVNALANGLPYRLEEVNNYFKGGARDVSDTFASALWGLDFMYWWAAHDATGLNFHTGDRVSSGFDMNPSKYTAYFSTSDGFNVRPLGYGIKAFDLGGHGRFARATVSNPNKLNVDAYAVLGDDKDLYVTIINNEHGSGARDARIALSADGFSSGQMAALAAPNNDITVKTGVTFGGAKINDDGSWNGSWTALPFAGRLTRLGTYTGTFPITVPASSAVVVKLMAN